jgi:hypothetical protein
MRARTRALKAEAVWQHRRHSRDTARSCVHYAAQLLSAAVLALFDVGRVRNGFTDVRTGSKGSRHSCSERERPDLQHTPARQRCRCAHGRQRRADAPTCLSRARWWGRRQLPSAWPSSASSAPLARSPAAHAAVSVLLPLRVRVRGATPPVIGRLLPCRPRREEVTCWTAAWLSCRAGGAPAGRSPAAS